MTGDDLHGVRRGTIIIRWAEMHHAAIDVRQPESFDQKMQCMGKLKRLKETSEGHTKQTAKLVQVLGQPEG